MQLVLMSDVALLYVKGRRLLHSSTSFVVWNATTDVKINYFFSCIYNFPTPDNQKKFQKQFINISSIVLDI